MVDKKLELFRKKLFEGIKDEANYFYFKKGAKS